MAATDLYLFAMPVWVPYAAFADPVVKSPRVYIVAPHLASRAQRAVQVLDRSLYREIADQFLRDEGAELVAERLGGELIGAHGVATLIGAGLPEELEEVLALLGALYAPQAGRAGRPEPSESAVRRVPGRG